MTDQTMSSQKSYLIKALYEWVLDNDCTPHVVVNAGSEGVLVPQEHVKDGQIVLNIGLGSVHGLLFDDYGISFNARFSGIPQDLYVPWFSVMALYAAENGKGMGFPLEEAPKGFSEFLDGVGVVDPEPEPPKPKKKVSHLKIVK
jgi:stringent starvation protein B